MARWRSVVVSIAPLVGCATATSEPDPYGSEVSTDDTTSGGVPNENAPGWSEPEAISLDNGYPAGGASAATLEPGRVLLAWHQSDGTSTRVWVKSYDFDAGFGEAEPIDGGAAETTQVKLHVDATGNVMATWIENNATLVARRFEVGSGWGAIEPIGSDVQVLDQTSTGDALGDVMVAWRNTVADSVLVNRYEPNVGWGTAEVLYSDANGVGAVNLYGNATGDAILRVNAGEQSDNFITLYYQPETGWGSAEPTPGTGNLAMAPNGDAMTFWYEISHPSTYLNSAYYTLPGGWVSTGFPQYQNLGLRGDAAVAAFDASNTAYVLVQQQNGGGSLLAMRYSQARWSPIEELEQGPFRTTVDSPQIVVNDAGSGIAAWHRVRVTDGPESSLWVSTLEPYGQWTPGAKLPLARHLLDRFAIAKLTIDSLGNGLAVWHDASGNLLVNARPAGE